MEQLLHYVWKHKMFPLSPLKTTDNKLVEVVDSGLYNIHAGPDFFNAKIKIDRMLWVGNIEIHDKSSDWYTHGHDQDARYNNVILHVCGKIDTEVYTQSGNKLLQIQLDVPLFLQNNYHQLLQKDKQPACYEIIQTIDHFKLHSWLTALQTERLQDKTKAIQQRVRQCNGSWEAALFVTMARNYGFGINGEAFETWALNIPLQEVAHHRDHLQQIEAIFFGQAGLLSDEIILQRPNNDLAQDIYYQQLKKEYEYLKHKFHLQPMNPQLWRFLRLRPQNFPHIRIAQLAKLYHEQRGNLSQLIECTTLKAVYHLLRTSVTPYWQTHYSFGENSLYNTKNLSQASLQLLTINTVVPILFAYGSYLGKESLCDQAFTFLEQLKAENNHITRTWKDCGIEINDAGTSQALIQLQTQYCDKHDCLRCRIGYEFLKQKR